MSKTTYASTSPYSVTGQTSWYLKNLTYRSVPPAGDDQIVTLSKRYEHRPDLLSYDQYGTPMYWWVFMVRNPDQIKDAIWDMTAGTVIYVPTLSGLRKALGT